jgi:hypothetical protein
MEKTTTKRYTVVILTKDFSYTNYGTQTVKMGRQFRVGRKSWLKDKGALVSLGLTEDLFIPFEYLRVANIEETTTVTIREV